MDHQVCFVMNPVRELCSSANVAHRSLKYPICEIETSGFNTKKQKQNTELVLTTSLKIVHLLIVRHMDTYSKLVSVPNQNTKRPLRRTSRHLWVEKIIQNSFAFNIFMKSIRDMNTYMYTSCTLHKHNRD